MPLLDKKKKIVLDDENEYTVLEDVGDFIAYFKPGRTVYVNSGSEYLPAKIVFATVYNDINKEYVEVTPIMEVSPRR